jgi:hypothetical protein
MISYLLLRVGAGPSVPTCTSILLMKSPLEQVVLTACSVNTNGVCNNKLKNRCNKDKKKLSEEQVTCFH